MWWVYLHKEKTFRFLPLIETEMPLLRFNPIDDNKIAIHIANIYLNGNQRAMTYNCQQNDYALVYM